MKKRFLRFLCRYYYRYRIYYFIKNFVNHSKYIYQAKSFYKIGKNKYLFVVAVHKRYNTQKASISIIKPYVEWNVDVSFKRVNTQLWRDLFDLDNKIQQDLKQPFWDWQ